MLVYLDETIEKGKFKKGIITIKTNDEILFNSVKNTLKKKYYIDDTQHSRFNE